MKTIAAVTLFFLPISTTAVRFSAASIPRLMTNSSSVGVHRDVKPENILYVSQPGGQYQLQLGDFGLCNRAISAATSVGTPIYNAPEMVLEGDQIQKVDIWYSLSRCCEHWMQESFVRGRISLISCRGLAGGFTCSLRLDSGRDVPGYLTVLYSFSQHDFGRHVCGRQACRRCVCDIQPTFISGCLTTVISQFWLKIRPYRL
jgi:serine/threonine protein kinase